MRLTVSMPVVRLRLSNISCTYRYDFPYTPAELKEEVSTLQSMMQIEQSMYQTSNEALKLVMDAQNEQLYQSSSTDELKGFDHKLSTNEELEAFDKKAEDYDNTVVKDAEKQKSKSGESIFDWFHDHSSFLPKE